MEAASYPTPHHADAATKIVEFFSRQPGVEGVLLVNSCARGKASADSCLDIIVLVSETLRDPGYDSQVLERDENERTHSLYRAWDQDPATRPHLAALSHAGRFAEVHLDITDGRLTPGTFSRDQALDSFEIAIGNYFVYSVPLWLGSSRYHELQQRWLPYYDELLRAGRLSITREFCVHYIEHIEPYVGRGLYFQAFDRLYQAFQRFLQGLIIARRVYPIAYNKWIHEQVVEILGLPELYARLPTLFEIGRLESRELIVKGAMLNALVEEYLPV